MPHRATANDLPADVWLRVLELLRYHPPALHQLTTALPLTGASRAPRPTHGLPALRAAAQQNVLMLDYTPRAERARIAQRPSGHAEHSAIDLFGQRLQSLAAPLAQAIVGICWQHPHFAASTFPSVDHLVNFWSLARFRPYRHFDFVRAVVERDGLQLAKASRGLRQDVALALPAVRQNGLALSCVGAALQNDRQVVLAALQQNGLALLYASRFLQEDPVVVQAAVKQCGQALVHAAPALRDDCTIVRIAMEKTPSTLIFASERLRDDKAVVMLAVERDGLLLRHASRRLQADLTLVRAAVAENGLALRWASAAAQSDALTAQLAVCNDGEALQYVAAALRADEELVRTAIANDAAAYAHASEALQKKAPIALLVLQSNEPLPLDELHPELLADKEFVLAAIAYTKGVLHGVSATLRGDPDVILASVRHQAAIEWDDFGDFSVMQQQFTGPYGNNAALMHAIVQYDGLALQFASPHVLRDKAIALAAVRQWGSALQHAGPQHQSDAEVVLAAIAQNAEALAFAAPFLQDDDTIVRVAMTHDPLAGYLFCSERLRRHPDRARRALAHAGRDERKLAALVKALPIGLRRDFHTALAFAEAFVDGLHVFDWQTLGQSNAWVERLVHASRGVALAYLSAQQRDDPRWVMQAVRLNGMALRYASDRLRADATVVMAALTQTPLALRFASASFRTNKALVVSLMQRDPLVFALLDEPLRGDFAMAMHAVQMRGGLLEFVSPLLRRDKALVQQACRQDPSALRFAHSSCRDDIDCALAATGGRGLRPVYASPRLGGDHNSFQAALALERLVAAP